MDFIKTKNLILFLSIVFAMACIIATAGQAQAESKKYKRTVEKYVIPEVTLVNQDGKKIRLPALIGDDQTVVIDFIYGTCTTICPVLSAGFVNLQNRLTSEGKAPPRLISITIDPENDSPAVMKEYLKRYRAKPGWEFLTGTRSDIDRVMRAFNAYIPDKMSHYPLNLIYSPKEKSWIRLFGIMSSRELLDEYRTVQSR